MAASESGGRTGPAASGLHFQQFIDALTGLHVQAISRFQNEGSRLVARFLAYPAGEDFQALAIPGCPETGPRGQRSLLSIDFCNRF